LKEFGGKRETQNDVPVQRRGEETDSIEPFEKQKGTEKKFLLRRAIQEKNGTSLHDINNRKKRYKKSQETLFHREIQ